MKIIKNFTTFTGYCLLLEAATIKIQHEFSLLNIYLKATTVGFPVILHLQ